MGIVEESVMLWWGNIESMASLVVSMPELSIGQKELLGIPKEPSSHIVIQVRGGAHHSEVMVELGYAFIVQVA
jgi:hypothetical protein